MLVFPIVEEGGTDEWFFMSSLTKIGSEDMCYRKDIQTMYICLLQMHYSFSLSSGVTLGYHYDWFLTTHALWHKMNYYTICHFTFPEFKPLACHGHLLPNVILAHDIGYILVHYWQHWVTVYKVSKYMSCHVSISQYTDIQIYCIQIVRQTGRYIDR